MAKQYKLKVYGYNGKNVFTGYIEGKQKAIDYGKRVAKGNLARDTADMIYIDIEDGNKVIHSESYDVYTKTFKRGNPSRVKRTVRKAVKRTGKVLSSIPGKVVKVTKDSITLLLPKGGAEKLKRSNPGVKIRNIAKGFVGPTGKFHPMRQSWDYDPDRAGEWGEEDQLKAQREARKRVAAKKRASKVSVKGTSAKKTVRRRNPTKVKSWRIGQSYEGHFSTYSDYYSYTEAKKIARNLSKEYDGVFSVFEEGYSATDKFENGKARNPAKKRVIKKTVSRRNPAGKNYHTSGTLFKMSYGGKSETVKNLRASYGTKTEVKNVIKSLVKMINQSKEILVLDIIVADKDHADVFEGTYNKGYGWTIHSDDNFGFEEK